MLIEFSVSNFLSFHNRASLSMVSSKPQGEAGLSKSIFFPTNYQDIPLLSSAAIYGANASGKTNLLLAIRAFRNLILRSTDRKLGELLAFTPFGLTRQSQHESTRFEMEFIAVDGVRYIYGFSYDWDSIVEEHLSSFANRRRADVFVREKGKPIKFGSSFKGHKKSLEDQLQGNHLLLTKAANSNFEQFFPIYHYFGTNCISLGSKFENSLFSRQQSFKDPLFLEKISLFLRFADTGIDFIRVSKHEEEGAKINTEVIHQTKGDAVIEQISWPLERESSGTVRLFALAGPIIDVLDRGAVLFLDELNTHFHPRLSEGIVSLFNNPETNPKMAQLIFTTHDATLLNKDNFRRDQIWFVEKNANHETRLFSLSDFDKKEVRWDVPFDKWYLSGRFGAMPSINDLNFNKP